jgi:MFS family permease
MVELGYKMGGIGTLASLAIIPNVVLLPFIGILIDSVGRRPMATLTGLTTFSALLIPTFTSSYEALLLAYTFFFFSFLAGQPSRSALLADSIEEELGIAFAKTFMPFNVARTVIPFIAGFLAEIYGYSAVFLAFGLLTVVGTLFFAFYSIEPIRKREKINLVRELKNAFILEKNLLRLYVFAIIDRFAWQLWFPLLNAHLKELSMSPSEVGILNSVTSGVMSITAYFSGGVIDRIGSFKGLALAEAFGILAAIMLSVISNKILVTFPFILVGISLSLWIPAYNVAVATRSIQQRRGKAYSKMNTVRTVFSIPAPHIGGFIYDSITPSAPFILSILLMTANILLLRSGRFRYSKKH